jgi:hypothetical protein
LASGPPFIVRSPEANRPNDNPPQLSSAGLRLGLRPCSICPRPFRLGCNRCLDSADQSQPTRGDGETSITILSFASTPHEAPVTWRNGRRKALFNLLADAPSPAYAATLTTKVFLAAAHLDHDLWRWPRLEAVFERKRPILEIRNLISLSRFA